MFHTILTLSYLIPNIYLIIRLWQLYIDPSRRLLFIIVYSILFSIYPISNLFEDSTGILPETITLVANYLLPFFLYLFLFVLLTDLLLLFNLLFKIIPASKLRERPVRSKVFIAITGAALAVVVAGIINFNTIRTSEYKITAERGSSDLEGLRIAFVSDFHLQEKVPQGFVEKFVAKVAEINPDLLLFGGDIVEGDPDDGNLMHFEELLTRIKTRFGVFGVLGNHEHYAGQDQGNFFDRSGIVLLRDSVIIQGASFVLAGRNDSRSRNRMTAEELMRGLPDSLPLILIDHRPTEPEQISMTTADLSFSGHTHHGQLFPINLITGVVYELSYGYMKKRNTHFFVSSGIRLWGPPVRTTGKSEILVVEISFQ